MDVATKNDTLWPKVATIHAMSVGWVDFARALHAVPLFGVGFGELLRPTMTTTIDQPCCASTAPVPVGKDFLAVYGADIETIMRRGSKRKNPWRLVGNIHWHSPGGTAFESCSCKSHIEGGDRGNGDYETQRGHGSQGQQVRHCIRGEHGKRGLEGLLGKFGLSQQRDRETVDPASRVQVLLPTTFSRLYGRGLRSPAEVISTGGVIFGHSWKFPLKWSLTNDIPPDDCEPDPPSVDDVSSLMDDSGIGTSASSSSGTGELRPPLLYGLGSNPRLSYTNLDDLSSGYGTRADGASNGEAVAGSYREDSRKRLNSPLDVDEYGSARKLRRVEKMI